MTVEIRQSIADPIAVDTGNIGVQGRVVSKTIQLTLFTLNENAVWGGRQHLLKASYPFAMLQLVANRRAFRIEVGDCFKFSYSKHGISEAIFRVLQKEEQELESENIVISAIEDFYFISRVIDEYSIPTDYTGTRPDYTLSPFTAPGSIAGTIAVTNGNVAVVGTSTLFLQWETGHQIQLPDGNWYTIATITDNTHLTISIVYPGANASGQAYDMSQIVKQMAMEVPYAMTNNSDIEILLVACWEGQFDLGFDAYMSIDNGASYLLLSNNVGNIAPFGQVVDATYPETYTIDTETGFTMEFRKEADVALVETTTWANTIAGIENIALLGNEIIFFKTITPVSGLKYKIENIIRGRMDTVKVAHAIGTNFYVLSKDLIFLSHDEIVAGVNRDFKLVPYNIQKRGDIALAVPIDLDITGRWRTPYIPGNFMANGSGFAGRYATDVILTWSPRYRGKGAGIGTPGIVSAESDREGFFSIEVWVGEIKVRTTNSIDAATWTYTEAMNLTDNGSLAEEVLFKILNYRTESGMLYESVQTEVICKKYDVPLS